MSESESLVVRAQTRLAAFRSSSERFGQQLAEHVAAGPFLFGGEPVDFGERGGVEADGDVVSRVVPRHDGSVAQCCTVSHICATVSHMTTEWGQEMSEQTTIRGYRFTLRADGQVLVATEGAGNLVDVFPLGNAGLREAASTWTDEWA